MQDKIRYYKFSMSPDTIRKYLDEVIAEKAACRADEYEESYPRGVLDGVMSALSVGDIQFDAGDNAVCALMEDLIRECGHDKRGVYSQVSQAAYANLCAARGIPAARLENKPEKTGWFAKAKSKIKGLFGRKKSDTPQDDVRTDDAPQTDAPAAKYRIEPDAPREMDADTPAAPVPGPTPSKSHFFILAAGLTQVAAITAAMILTGNKGAMESAQNDAAQDTGRTTRTVHRTDAIGIGAAQKTYMAWDAAARAKAQAPDSLMRRRLTTPARDAVKTAAKPAAAHVAVPGGSLKDVLMRQQKSMDSLMTYRPAVRTTATAQTAAKVQKTSAVRPATHAATVRPAARATITYAVSTDSVAMQLTRASKSSLNILMGTKGADALCARVRAKIDAGIFAAPHGMSVERIAHAITMSRIYEGHSVVLDAMQATAPLTAAQQAAFDAHLASIGDLGTGLQQKMAAKHKLSTHSKYAAASKQLKQTHAKNLKQLKQLRKMAHVR